MSLAKRFCVFCMDLCLSRAISKKLLTLSLNQPIVRFVYWSHRYYVYLYKVEQIKKSPEISRESWFANGPRLKKNTRTKLYRMDLKRLKNNHLQKDMVEIGKNTRICVNMLASLHLEWNTSFKLGTTLKAYSL